MVPGVRPLPGLVHVHAGQGRDLCHRRAVAPGLPLLVIGLAIGLAQAMGEWVAAGRVVNGRCRVPKAALRIEEMAQIVVTRQVDCDGCEAGFPGPSLEAVGREGEEDLSRVREEKEDLAIRQMGDREDDTSRVLMEDYGSDGSDDVRVGEVAVVAVVVAEAQEIRRMVVEGQVLNIDIRVSLNRKHIIATEEMEKRGRSEWIISHPIPSLDQASSTSNSSRGMISDGQN